MQVSASFRQQARPGGEAEARLREKDKLSAAYNRDRRKRIDALCEGEHGEKIKDLSRFLRRMDLTSGRDLIARIEAADWAQGMPPNDRLLLLSIISGAILSMRERNGLPAFEDPIWDQPPNVFQQIKAILKVI